MPYRLIGPGRLLLVLLAWLPLLAGCVQSKKFTEKQLAQSPVPRELNKQMLPDYVIEPPDILIIDALSIIPKPPYRVAAGDILLIRVPNAFETEPIDGPYVVEPEGTVNLGLTYGTVKLVGKTLDEARAAVRLFLAKESKDPIKDPKVQLALGQSRALQVINGQHLVTPDGTVRLGVYGGVPVAGMTLEEARRALESHLGQFLQDPELSVRVSAYNSKLYYIIFDGAGSGQQIVRLPITGNDTVLDALAQAGGLTPVSSKHKIWVARPAPPGAPCDQVLPVDWDGIVTRGRTATNYQLLPGDRIYVKGNALIAADTFLAQLFAPVERISGAILLVNGVIRSLGPNSGNNNAGTGFFFP